MKPRSILLQILEAVSGEETTVHQIVCKTGLDQRTVKKYLDLLIEIQAAGKIVKMHEGLRVIVRQQR